MNKIDKITKSCIAWGMVFNLFNRTWRWKTSHITKYCIERFQEQFQRCIANEFAIIDGFVKQFDFVIVTCWNDRNFYVGQYWTEFAQQIARYMQSIYFVGGGIQGDNVRVKSVCNIWND